MPPCIVKSKELEATSASGSRKRGRSTVGNEPAETTDKISTGAQLDGEAFRSEPIWDHECPRCHWDDLVRLPTLGSDGAARPLCVRCVQRDRCVTKEVLAAATDAQLDSGLFVLPPVLDDEWRALIVRRRPKHVAWFQNRDNSQAVAANEPLPPLDGLVTLAATPTPALMSWLTSTQCSSLRTLVLYDTADDETLAALRSLVKLNVLALWNASRITDAGLVHLATLPTLEALDLPALSDRVTAAGLAHALPPKLRSLNLSACACVNTFALSHFHQLSCLQKLVVARHLKNDGLCHLASLPQLQRLSLISCDNTTAVGLHHLRSLLQLQALTLRFCKFFNNLGLAKIAPLTSLLALSIIRCNEVTDDGLAHLASLSKLKSLTLCGCNRITDRGLRHISSLLELRRLSIDSCDLVKDAGLAHLAPLSQLEDLSLSRCPKVTHRGVAYLQPLTQLKNLDLSYTAITDAALIHVGTFTKLHELNFSGCTKLKCSGFEHLQSLVQLQTLNLSCLNITDAVLSHLNPLTQLSSLDLGACEKVTDAGVAHLRVLTRLKWLNVEDCKLVTRTCLEHVGFVCDVVFN